MSNKVTHLTTLVVPVPVDFLRAVDNMAHDHKMNRAAFVRWVLAGVLRVSNPQIRAGRPRKPRPTQEVAA